VDVVDRHPVELAEAPVDGAGEAFQLLTDAEIGLDALARGRGDLCQHDLPPVLRVGLQELPEGLELLRQALGVVEAVNPDDPAHPATLYEGNVAAGPGEIGQVDADRKAGNGQKAVEHPDASIRRDAAQHAVRHVVDEVRHVGLGLQADKVIGGQAAREQLVLGNGDERPPRREGDMQIEPDAVDDAELPQLDRQWDQVVVVHPNYVVRPQHRLQECRQAPVHADVLLEVPGFELSQVQPVVKHRPKHRVGIAEVVSFVLGRRERNGNDASRLLDHARLLGRLDLAIPTKPQRGARACDIGEGHSNAASLRCSAQVGHSV